MLLPLLLLLPTLALSLLHDSDVSGICSIDWDEVEDQLTLDNSVCCDEKLHKEVYKTLSRLNRKHANQTEVLYDVIPLVPSGVDAHIVATDGVLAISAPGLGGAFCKQRVGSAHVLIQQSPIDEPFGFSSPDDRVPGCIHAGLTQKVGEIVHEWKMPGRMTPGQMIKIFSKSLFSALHTRIWLALSEKRVAFRSNSQLTCEFPVGDRLHLTVFTFQVLPTL